ncbi:uncharacterized protein LOC117322445 [Pecten maximus]|uniref:uncharacterized protein LOC117322445 n=1 Tax=Pecten maximus TaxID=6579 RepID=UPI001458406F|nr:uncharacterized protein LOC117322445 [Pecten maximus]XP_033733254.1 uncharacterized protein LOC117322445 [Pecten maximus]
MQSKLASEQQVEMMVPHLTASYYDRTDHFSAHGIICVLAEYFIEAEAMGFFTARLAQENMRTFTVQENIVYSPKLHRKASKKNGDLLHRVFFASIGQTSYAFTQDLLDPSSKEQLVHLESKVVNIDPETRRPSKLPSWVTERFSNFEKIDKPILSTRQEDIIPPHDAFKTVTRTRPSDMDSNFHVNFSVFYRFCTDCATEASLAGHYRHFKDDMCWFPVLETKATFLGEAPASVMLDVYSWQDTDHEQRLYFAIYRKNERIFQASFLYSLVKSTQQSISKM